MMVTTAAGDGDTDGLFCGGTITDIESVKNDALLIFF